MTPPLSPEEFERLQRRMEAVTRALEQSDSIPRILEQIDLANRAIPPGVLGPAVRAAQEGLAPLQESGALARIGEQANLVLSRLEQTGALAELADRSSTMLAAIDSTGAFSRMRRQVASYVATLEDETVIPADLDTGDLHEPPDTTTRESLLRAIGRIDRLILVLFVQAGQLAADTSGSHAAAIVFDALGVLVALRAILTVFAAGSGDER